MLATALDREAWAWVNLGEPDQAIADDTRARELWLAAGDTRNAAKALHGIAIDQKDKGDLPEAQKSFEEALREFHRIGASWDIASCSNNLGILFSEQGDLEHAREHMRRQGVDPDKVPWDYQKLLEDLRPGAEKAVKRALLIEAIAEKEGLAAADADVDAEIERVAQASQRPAPAVRRMLEQSGDLEGIRHSLGERRTIDFLIEKNQAKTA